jgi:hypothetical protein
MSFEKRVRSLDIFKKVPSDFAQATNLGGFLSILTVVLIVFFTAIELNNYLSPEYSAEINMDQLFTREEMTYLPKDSASTSIYPFPHCPARSSRSTSKTPCSRIRPTSAPYRSGASTKKATTSIADPSNS